MNFSVKEIERALFEAIRQYFVGEGYMPDINDTTTESDYDSAVAAISASGKEQVHLFGVGFMNARDNVKQHSIYIDRRETETSLGAWGTKTHRVEGDGSFTRMQRPSRALDLTYQVSFVTNSTEYARLIELGIFESFPSFGSIPTYNDDRTPTGKRIDILIQDNQDTSGEDFIERTLLIKVTNVFIQEDKVEVSDIVPLTDFDPELKENE